MPSKIPSATAVEALEKATAAKAAHAVALTECTAARQATMGNGRTRETRLALLVAEQHMLIAEDAVRVADAVAAYELSKCEPEDVTERAHANACDVVQLHADLEKHETEIARARAVYQRAIDARNARAASAYGAHAQLSSLRIGQGKPPPAPLPGDEGDLLGALAARIANGTVMPKNDNAARRYVLQREETELRAQIEGDRVERVEMEAENARIAKQRMDDFQHAAKARAVENAKIEAEAAAERAKTEKLAKAHRARTGAP